MEAIDTRFIAALLYLVGTMVFEFSFPVARAIRKL